MSDSINRLIVRQREIASVIRSWLEWDTGNRAEHGLTVEGNTHIMALPVPVWPTHSQFVCWIETCEGAADALASQPSATDYRNRGERDAAYWREIADKLAEALDGVRCYANDARSGHLIDRDLKGPVCNEMATEDCFRMVAALNEYELARISAEALR